MTTITGYTAEKMDEIANSTVIDGNVVDGNLILKTRDDTEIDAGSVVGGTGPTGPSGIVPCTSITRPGSPALGQGIWETDTKKFLIWNGVRWDPPWNIGWGRVASATKVTDQDIIATGLAEVTGTDATWTAVANRRYRITVKTVLENTTVIRANVVVADETDSVVDEGGGIYLDNSNHYGHGWSYEETGIAAGSRTRKLQAQVGSGTLTVKGTIGKGIQIIVEDIGPNGNPV